MNFENSEIWLLALRAVLLLAAFAGFAWALVASRRDTALGFLRLSTQHAQALNEIQQLSTQLQELTAQVRDLSLPSPMVSRPAPATAPPPAPAVSSITPSGARGYEMAIRMARGGASIEEIVSSCGTTRSEARLLRRLHCAGGASAA
jgi:hypothetical protein